MGLGWGNYPQFGTCHGRIYWRLPFAMVGVLTFCPMWIVWGKRREGKKNREIMEEEQRSFTIRTCYNSSEVLFTSSSVSGILGVGYTVETVWDVAYNPEPGIGWNIKVSNARRTERFFSLSSNKRGQGLSKIGGFGSWRIFILHMPSADWMIIVIFSSLGFFFCCWF